MEVVVATVPEKEVVTGTAVKEVCGGVTRHAVGIFCAGVSGGVEVVIFGEVGTAGKVNGTSPRHVSAGFSFEFQRPVREVQVDARVSEPECVIPFRFTDGIFV